MPAAQRESEDRLTGAELVILTWLQKNSKAKSLGVHWWSLRKIAEGVGYSPSTVLRHVHVLEREGHIKLHRGPAQAYGYEVL